MLAHAISDDDEPTPKDDAPTQPDPAPHLAQDLKDWIDRHLQEEVAAERAALSAS